MSKKAEAYIAVGGSVVPTKFDPTVFLRKLNAKLVEIEYDFKTYSFPEDPTDIGSFKMLPEILEDIGAASKLISGIRDEKWFAVEALIPSNVRGILLEVLSNFIDVFKAGSQHMHPRKAKNIAGTVVRAVKQAITTTKRTKLNPDYMIILIVREGLNALASGIQRYYTEAV